MRMLERKPPVILPLLALAILTHLSNVEISATFFSISTSHLQQADPSNLPARFGRLRRAVNLTHWSSQAPDYSKTHLESHTTAQDIALIKTMGFDHVRLPIEPAPLLGGTPDPSILNSTYLRYVDTALDMILATDRKSTRLNSSHLVISYA